MLTSHHLPHIPGWAKFVCFVLWILGSTYWILSTAILNTLLRTDWGLNEMGSTNLDAWPHRVSISRTPRNTRKRGTGSLSLITLKQCLQPLNFHSFFHRTPPTPHARGGHPPDPLASSTKFYILGLLNGSPPYKWWTLLLCKIHPSGPPMTGTLVWWDPESLQRELRPSMTRCWSLW